MSPHNGTMSPPHFSRLCSLVNDSLLPYIEKGSEFPTNEKEKNLLIVLTQISRQIKSWTDALDSDSDGDEIMVNLVSSGKCCQGLDPLFEGGHFCLVNVVYTLVVLLTIENQYVQHTTGSVLVVISNFLVKSGNDVNSFLQLLWASIEVALLGIHSSTSIPATGSTIIADEKPAHYDIHSIDCNTTRFISLLQPKLVNANWVTATTLVQVLRKILKSLKHDYGELPEEYVCSFSYSFLNVSWDLLLDGNMGSLESKDFFLASVLQFFCSLVEQRGSEEDSGSNFDELPLGKIRDLVPKFLHWGLSRHSNSKRRCISRYLRHKILMLMVRLSIHIHHQCSTLALWLQLLRQYFEDVLYLLVSEQHDDLDNCLEGSPFLISIADGENVDSLCNRHLQRQAIFLLLKCSFSLISFSKGTARKCLCIGKEPCTEKGLSELYEWFKRCMSLEKILDCKTFSNLCSSFALSFLQLYMDEDGFLFEMLLQLLEMPLPSKPIQYKQDVNMLEELKGDALSYIWSIFNPIHLFHLFLAELHYDHQVLLDYLISKYTGVCCLQYLLRCLRLISKSWHIFVEFSVCESQLSQSSCKKRKVCTRSQHLHGKVEVSLPPIKGVRGSNALEKHKKRRLESGSMPTSFSQKAFENAKGCLLSLKESLENLHQKKLFPYNPSPLLRSFTRFQELCQQQEREDLQKTDIAAA